MKYFEFDTEQEANAALDQVNNAQPFNVKKVGKSQHRDNAKIQPKPYTSVIPHNGKWYILADNFTQSVFSELTPVNVEFPEPNEP